MRLDIGVSPGTRLGSRLHCFGVSRDREDSNFEGVNLLSYVLLMDRREMVAAVVTSHIYEQFQWYHDLASFSCFLLKHGDCLASTMS